MISFGKHFATFLLFGAMEASVQANVGHSTLGATPADIVSAPASSVRGLPYSTRAAIDASLKRYERSSEPGCAVGVYRSGTVLYADAFGLADVDSDLRNTAETSINIGSIAKQFTAAGVVLLAQEGKLSLDDDVRKHIPELPVFGPPITIRRLLTHTSGMRDYRGLLNLAGHRNDEVVRAPRILEILALQRGLNFPPGEQVLYGNGGYFLAGLIIERLSGLPFQTFMRKRVFEPLGMMRTRFKGDTEGLPSLAKHHAPSGEGQFQSFYERWEEDGPGDLYSTIEDLARWDANFRSGVLGGPELVQALQTRDRLNDGRQSEYGLGLRHGAMHGHRMIGHTGQSEGSISTYQRFPDAGLSVAAICNRTDGPAHDLALEIAKLVLPANNEAGPPPFLAEYLHQPSAPVEKWSGTYHALGNSTVISVRAEDGNLKVELPGLEFPLKPLGSDVYQLVGGPYDSYVRFFAASGEQPQRMVPLNSDDPPMFAFKQVSPTAGNLLALSGDYRCPEFRATIRIRLENGILLADIPPDSRQVMEPLGRNQFAFERLVFAFDDPIAGASPGFRLDQWRARGMRCHRTIGAN